MDNPLVFTPQMMVVLVLLAITVVLFVTEVVRMDVTAISVMIVLGVIGYFPGMEQVSDAEELFNGFANNAVLSLVAVMIMGAGLSKSGIMEWVAEFILRKGGRSEKRLMPIISGISAIISGFVQNLGVAALLLPVVSRISARTLIPRSRLLIPMAFCCLLGGNLTMIGSGPLILLNDLLPRGMPHFTMFCVTPVGLALVITGIAYFMLFGRVLLPSNKVQGFFAESTLEYYQRVYGLDYVLHEMRVGDTPNLSNRTVRGLEEQFNVVVVGALFEDEIRIGPWSGLEIRPHMHLAVLGNQKDIKRLAKESEGEIFKELDVFERALSRTQSGIAEVIIPPSSKLISQTPAGIAMRKTYGLSVLAVRRGHETITKGRRDVELRAGDILVCHCSWRSLGRLRKNRDFVVMTTGFPYEEHRSNKIVHALLFFALAIGLSVFSGMRLSLSLMIGAVGMILSGVLTIDEAYRSISWRVVFLLAGLMPLGLAVENTGAAAWIANAVLGLLGNVRPWVLQVVIALLATCATLVMSNFAAAVLLVPTAIQFALVAQGMGIDADPRVFALTVALATSNTFLLPTNQVNALIMGPGDYRVKDFTKAGAGLSVLFVIVMVLMLNIIPV